MKIAVTIFRENESVPFRKTLIKNVTDEDALDAALEESSDFIGECFDEITEEELIS